LETMELPPRGDEVAVVVPACVPSSPRGLPAPVARRRPEVSDLPIGAARGDARAGTEKIARQWLLPWDSFGSDPDDPSLPDPLSS
jgi:hypothetical protein